MPAELMAVGALSLDIGWNRRKWHACKVQLTVARSLYQTRIYFSSLTTSSGLDGAMWGPRRLLLRSEACQRLSTFSINSRNSAILAVRFAAFGVPETAGGECRLRPTLVLSTSLYWRVIVCGCAALHHRLIQRCCAVCDTPVFLLDHRIG
jgi:hypothetical protein